MGARRERVGLDSERESSLEAGESFSDELLVPERELFFAIKHLIFVVPKRHRMSVQLEDSNNSRPPETGNFLRS